MERMERNVRNMRNMISPAYSSQNSGCSILDILLVVTLKTLEEPYVVLCNILYLKAALWVYGVFLIRHQHHRGFQSMCPVHRLSIYCQLSVTGVTGLVKAEQCRQNIHNTPTSSPPQPVNTLLQHYWARLPVYHHITRHNCLLTVQNSDYY